MNRRPKAFEYLKEDFSIFGRLEDGIDLVRYAEDLEAYCDFLEEENKCYGEEWAMLEKREKPMMVHKKGISEEIKVGNITFKLSEMWYCPNCESWVSPSHDEKYCSKCGQRLVYEDE